MRNALVWASAACALMTLTSPVWGQAPSSERAVLWYRSSEGCPDWADFLARLGDRGALVRAAEVGDRVDFVVNIGMTASGARGRLERETERGTVAIREVEDARCERVADVVALNLALALDPERSAAGARTESSPPPPEGTPVAPSPGVAGAAAEPKERAPNAAAAEARPAPPPARFDQGAEPARVDSARESAAWRAGLQGGVLAVMQPAVHVRGTAFLERSAGFTLLPELALRGAFVAAFGSIDTSSGTVRQNIWAGRFELCPLRFGGPVLSLRPCAAGEVGQLRASRAYDASSLWWAIGGHLRGGWSVARAVALEAEIGMLVPLHRYEVSAGSSVLYRSAAAGVAASAGGSIAF